MGGGGTKMGVHLTFNVMFLEPLQNTLQHEYFLLSKQEFDILLDLIVICFERLIT